MITGASRGLGRAIAVALAGAGADVALAARSKAAGSTDVAALAAAAIVVVGHMLQLPDAPVTAVALISCFSLRVMAIRHGWRLPVAKIRDQRDPSSGKVSSKEFD